MIGCMRDTVVVDLDGTLADILHRVPLVHSDTPNWDRFYAECSNDRLNGWCFELMKAMKAAGFRVLIVSARSKQCEPETLAWLSANCAGAYDELHMLRAVGDYTKDHELKKYWLDSYGRDRILFVVDDRQRVVDMWRAEGLTCLQCASWEEFKRKPRAQAKLQGDSMQSSGDVVAQ